MHPNGTPPRLYGTLARMWVVALLVVAPAQAGTTLAGPRSGLITYGNGTNVIRAPGVGLTTYGNGTKGIRTPGLALIGNKLAHPGR